MTVYYNSPDVSVKSFIGSSDWISLRNHAPLPQKKVIDGCSTKAISGMYGWVGWTSLSSVTTGTYGCYFE